MFVLHCTIITWQCHSKTHRPNPQKSKCGFTKHVLHCQDNVPLFIALSNSIQLKFIVCFITARGKKTEQIALTVLSSYYPKLTLKKKYPFFITGLTMIKSSYTDQWKKDGPKTQIIQIFLNMLTLLVSICTSVN